MKGEYMGSMYTMTKEVCKAKIDEMSEILKESALLEHDKKYLTDMLSEAYHQLYEAYRIQQEFEDVIREELGDKTFLKLADIAISREGKHLEKVLFDDKKDTSIEWYDLSDE